MASHSSTASKKPAAGPASEMAIWPQVSSPRERYAERGS